MVARPRPFISIATFGRTWTGSVRYSFRALVDAYAVLVDAPPSGQFESLDCERLRGRAYDPDEPDQSIDVTLAFTTAAVVAEHVVPAARARDDLCEPLGSCNHGFEVGAPLSLFDDSAHEIAAAVDYDRKGRRCRSGRCCGATPPTWCS
jgi:hypothetical protein